MAKKKKMPTQAELAEFQKRAAGGIKSATQEPGMHANPYLNMLEKLKSLLGAGSFEDASKKKKGK